MAYLSASPDARGSMRAEAAPLTEAATAAAAAAAAAVGAAPTAPAAADGMNKTRFGVSSRGFVSVTNLPLTTAKYIRPYPAEKKRVDLKHWVNYGHMHKDDHHDGNWEEDGRDRFNFQCTRKCTSTDRLEFCATCDDPEAKEVANADHICGCVLEIKKTGSNWQRKKLIAHDTLHNATAQAAKVSSATANLVDNMTIAKRKTSSGNDNNHVIAKRLKGVLTGVLTGKERQLNQSAALAKWLMTSGTTFKNSELLSPDFQAYIASLDPTSRLLSQDELFDYGVANYEILKVALATEASEIMDKYTYNNPFAQLMSDAVTIHGHKMLSEAACFVPVHPAPPAVVATNQTRCPNGDSDAQATYMNETCEAVFLRPAAEVGVSAIFDEGALTVAGSMNMNEESCGLHVNSSFQKDSVGTNRTVNGKPSDDFPELTAVLNSARDLGKFILRPKVWAAYEKKAADMASARQKRINFWRIVLDHCKTRIGALFQMSDSLVMDRAMTKIMFSLWASEDAEFPPPNKMPRNLTDVEYKILEEVAHVMGLAKPQQLFTQYEGWYTAALEVLAQLATITAFDRVVAKDGSAEIPDVLNIGSESKSKVPMLTRQYADFEAIPLKLAERGAASAKQRFASDKVSARQKIAAYIDPRTSKDISQFANRESYRNATRTQYAVVYKTAELYKASKRKAEAADNPPPPGPPLLQRTNSKQIFDSDDSDDTDADSDNGGGGGGAAASGGGVAVTDTWSSVLNRSSSDFTRLANADFDRADKNWQKFVCKKRVFQLEPCILAALPADVVDGTRKFDALNDGVKLPMWKYFDQFEAGDKQLELERGENRFGYFPVLVRQYSGSRAGAGFTERMNSKAKSLMEAKQGNLNETTLRNKACCAMSRDFVEYATQRQPSKFSGAAWKEFQAKTERRALELKSTQDVAPDLGVNLVVMNANIELLDGIDEGPDGSSVWLVDLFPCKVMDAAIKKEWIKLHLPRPKWEEDVELYFCKYLNCTYLRDIEIVARISDGGGVPDAIFDKCKRRADACTPEQREKLIKKWLPEKGKKWRSTHTPFPEE